MKNINAADYITVLCLINTKHTQDLGTHGTRNTCRDFGLSRLNTLQTKIKWTNDDIMRQPERRVKLLHTTFMEWKRATYRNSQQCIELILHIYKTCMTNHSEYRLVWLTIASTGNLKCLLNHYTLSSSKLLLIAGHCDYTMHIQL